jgi:hypothetical protein
MTTKGQVERMLAIHAEWKRAQVEDDEFRIENVRSAVEHLPASGEPEITFDMDDERITFRDQAALDEYVAGAILEHSRYHGGGVDECSSNPASPCARTRDLPPESDSLA